MFIFFRENPRIEGVQSSAFLPFLASQQKRPIGLSSQFLNKKKKKSARPRKPTKPQQHRLSSSIFAAFHIQPISLVLVLSRKNLLRKTPPFSGVYDWRGRLKFRVQSLLQSMVLSRFQPIANLLLKSGMSIHRVLHRFVANKWFYCHSFQSVIYKMLFWSTVVSFIELCHDISFIASNCFAFWNGNDNSYEVKTNKRTNKQKFSYWRKMYEKTGQIPLRTSRTSLNFIRLLVERRKRLEAIGWISG